MRCCGWFARWSALRQSSVVRRVGGSSSSAEGYAQLPGEAWGLDDRTMIRFVQETQISVPGDGGNRFAERARFVTGPGREAWLQWRAGVLADFHRRIRTEVIAARSDAQLYLAPTNMFDMPELERELRPGLPSRGKIDQALLAVGIRPEAYRNEPGIVLLRQQRLSPPGSLAAQAIDLETNRSTEWDAAVRDEPTTGSLFFHEPQRTRLASFDAKSPFGKDKTYTWLVSQFSPSEDQNRRRFIHSLATLDSQAMFDGGWLLPLGQEGAIGDLVGAYRRLPAARFETLPGTIQPLTVRTLHTDRFTYAYLVNDSPWHVRATTQMAGPAPPPEELGGQHQMGFQGGWSVEMNPYDLVVVRFAAPDVKLLAPQISVPAEVKTALATHIGDLRERHARLVSPPPLAVLNNPGFELPAVNGGAPGWNWTNTVGTEVSLDTKSPRAGRQCLRMKTSGPVVTLRSEAFAVSQTGRLAISVWLKTQANGNQPSVRLALESAADGRQFYRNAPLGAGTNVPIPGQWKQIIFAIDDLPPDAPSQLRFRVDLSNPGELWIDDVLLYDLVFNDGEKIQLSKIIALADFQLSSDRLGDCLHELEGYWPQLLNAQAPLGPQPVANNPVGPPPKEAPEKSATKPALGRLKELWKF